MAEDEQRADIWGPDDAELEQWLEEWAEVDRSAAEYLNEAMRAIGWASLPGPDLERVVSALRAGAAAGAGPSDRDLWVAAAVATMSPSDDPADSVESQAVVAALQHVDWLGLVLGLVRRGVGAIPDAAEALNDIDALEDVDGEIEDPEGTIAVLEEAIEVLAPRWEALGILDDDRRLTRLGLWGLPVALREFWLDTGHAPPVDEELRSAALEVLADQPRSIDELRVALAKDQRIVDGDELHRTVIAEADTWELGDGTFAHLPTLLEGLVLTHQLDAEEVALGALDDGADLAIFGYLAEEGMPLRGAGQLVRREASHGYDVPGPSTSSLAGPPGWLDGFEQGDVVALRYSGGEAVLERAAFPTDPDGDERYANALVKVVRTAMSLARAEAAEEDPYGVWFADFVVTLRRDHRKILNRAHPPLGQLIAGVGLEVSGPFFGLPGTPWRGEPPWFDDRQRETWRAWLDAVGAASQDRLPDRVELAALAEGLTDSGLVDFVAADLDDTPNHVRLVMALGDAVDGALSAVPLLLEARLAELRGDGLRMLSLVEQAVAADPTNQHAAADLGDLRSVAGDAAEADRLYRLGGLDPLADEVVLVRHFLAPPADGPGRNKPCPCGSGKKYKVCHGRTATHPLPERAPWLWQKIMMFVQRPPNRAELLSWAGLLAGTGPEDREAISGAMSDPTTHDFATYDGGLLTRFITVWGPILPGDELELARQWLSAPRRLMEVEEVRLFRGLQVRDLVSGETLEILDKTMSRSTSVKDVLLARPLADGAGALRMQADGLRLPRLMRAPLLEIMREGRGEAIASFLAPKGPPEVVTTEGHEIVDSTARYTLSEPDRTWAELAARYDEHGPDGLVALGPGGSIRGHLTRDGDRLVLHAMSAERLRSLQEVLEEIDADADLIDVSSVPFGAVAEPSTTDQPAPQLSADDWAQLARSFEERWMAQEIPALGGMTPREAATGDRRPDLVALLDDIEWTQRAQPQPADMDLDRVRRDLGLA